MKPSVLALVSAVTVAACGSTAPSSLVSPEPRTTMELGNFSVSLSVRDLAASRAFYEKLGFASVGGQADQNWLILQNGTTTIGLFQGMFEGNILTFNPGWNHRSENLGEFTDVRELQRRLESRGVELHTRADESTTGPASFTLSDPDGNMILVDQHR